MFDPDLALTPLPFIYPRRTRHPGPHDFKKGYPPYLHRPGHDRFSGRLSRFLFSL